MKINNTLGLLFFFLSFIQLHSQECYPDTFEGEGTFYDGVAGSSSGNCSLPVANGDYFHCALNNINYDNSNACGACIIVTGPKGSVTLQVVDRCPECASGDVDMTEEAFSQIADVIDGRVPITWKYTTCEDNSNESIQIVFKEGSSKYYTAIQFRNGIHAISTMEYQLANGSWSAVPRELFNFFIATEGIPSPMNLRITSVLGEQLVFENITLTDNIIEKEISSNKQFSTPSNCIDDSNKDNETTNPTPVNPNTESDSETGNPDVVNPNTESDSEIENTTVVTPNTESNTETGNPTVVIPNTESDSETGNPTVVTPNTGSDSETENSTVVTPNTGSDSEMENSTVATPNTESDTETENSTVVTPNTGSDTETENTTTVNSNPDDDIVIIDLDNLDVQSVDIDDLEKPTFNILTSTGNIIATVKGDSSIFKISIFNLIGQQVETTKTVLNENDLNINTKKLATGIYIIRAEENNKVVLTRKIVIQN